MQNIVIIFFMLLDLTISRVENNIQPLNDHARSPIPHESRLGMMNTFTQDRFPLFLSCKQRKENTLSSGE